MADGVIVGIGVGFDVSACVLMEIGVRISCGVDNSVATGMGVEALSRSHPAEKIANIKNRKPSCFLLAAIDF